MSCAWLAAIIISVGSLSPTHAQTASPADSQTSAHRQQLPSLNRAEQFRALPGDALDISFPYVPEFNQTAVVQPDGMVILRNALPIRVSGLSLEQLTAKVREAYGQILRNPDVTVAPRDIEKPFFIAAGHVSRPGKYPVGEELDLTEAVAIAGGFTDQSKRSEVVLFRRVNGTSMFESHVYDLKKMLARTDLSEDPWVHPGDIVYVPQNTFSKVMRFVPSQNIGAYINPIP